MYEGAWRLSKYGTGETVLFNVEDDPQEQRNLVDAPLCREVYRDLDAKLTRWIMDAMVESHFSQRVYIRDLAMSTTFGREGWQTTYPRHIGDR